jgi:hypothetical protein
VVIKKINFFGFVFGSGVVFFLGFFFNFKRTDILEIGLGASLSGIGLAMGGWKLFEIFGKKCLQVECKVVHLNLDVGGVGLLHWVLKLEINYAGEEGKRMYGWLTRSIRLG